jgi:hypothetical protein
MSRLNPVARFSVIGVGMPEGGQGSCTDMDFGFWGGGVFGGTSVRVFVGGAFGRNFGCIVRMEACIQANTTLLCRSLEYGNISIYGYVFPQNCVAICWVNLGSSLCCPVLQRSHLRLHRRSCLHPSNLAW